MAAQVGRSGVGFFFAKVLNKAVAVLLIGFENIRKHLERSSGSAIA